MVALQIGAACDVLAGLVLFAVSFAMDPASDDESMYQARVIALLAILLIGIGALSLLVARGLRRRKRWAWQSARALFILLYLATLLPVGVVGLYGLLSAGTRAKFPSARRADRG